MMRSSSTSNHHLHFVVENQFLLAFNISTACHRGQSMPFKRIKKDPSWHCIKTSNGVVKDMSGTFCYCNAP